MLAIKYQLGYNTLAAWCAGGNRSTDGVAWQAAVAPFPFVPMRPFKNTCLRGHDLNIHRRKYKRKTRHRSKWVFICDECNRIRARAVRRMEREALALIRNTNRERMKQWLDK